ncbi:hypothetical protein IE53DRAFT_1644 [Violaceomyces palustris]|uniref:Uncharacterized protein n=1 Tax=Violaceomyces palustris TaxID=1673888 RepID=A0ACD0P8L2_9BASI|nr:hypothetical protein IE53DRAFT_1644 [Violaceomyces palustris]
MSTILGLKSTPYPLDPPGASTAQLLSAPYPPYPSYPLFSRVISQRFYEATLNPLLPFCFSIAYYVISHTANALVRKSGSRDLTKGETASARIIRSLVILHNAALAIYSGWTWLNMFPLVVDFFLQGWRASGFEGVKLALCSMPTNQINLGRYTYLFYMSKYYEVVDSIILLIKGKKISNLQSYHHAGAIICMWVATRYQSQPVWVFCVFNSFVHTLMYSYYLCSAMHWPFPKTLKRNLTTLQIAQIASGTVLTNLYLLTRLDPSLVARGYLYNRVSPIWSADHNNLSVYAMSRATSSDPQTCLQTVGAEVALHVNTLYMAPLLVLFFRFFTRSYLSGAPGKRGQRGEKKSVVTIAQENGHPKAE